MEEFIKNGIPNLFECDLDTQTAIVDLFVDQIIVKDDGLQMIWNQYFFLLPFRFSLTSHHIQPRSILYPVCLKFS